MGYGTLFMNSDIVVIMNQLATWIIMGIASEREEHLRRGASGFNFLSRGKDGYHPAVIWRPAGVFNKELSQMGIHSVNFPDGFLLLQVPGRSRPGQSQGG